MLAVFTGLAALLISPIPSPHPGAKPLPAGPSAALAAGKTQTVFLPLIFRPAAAMPVASSDLPVRSFEQRVLESVNTIRMARGLAPLRLTRELDQAAQSHSQDMADHNTLSHSGTDGSSPWERFRKVGYAMAYGGENIAAGAPGDPERIVNAWMASDGHRANILNGNYAETGAGYAYNASSDGAYWTQDFGSRAGVLPVVINGDALIASSHVVTLYLYNDKGGGLSATDVMISNEPGFVNKTWEPYRETRVWTLAPGTGWRTVYVQFRRVDGSTTQSSDDIFVKAP